MEKWLLAPDTRRLLAGLLLMALAAWPGFSRQHEAGHHATPSAVAAPPPSAADLAKQEADKAFSEFNHRFAGIFVLLIGILALLESRLAERFGVVRYLWFFFFFIPGIYLLFFSDPESWPLGEQTLHYVVTQNMQVLQHKIFSLLLLGLSVVEYLRIRNRLRGLWTAFLFPALAGAGAALLLFHSSQAHAAGMDPSAHLSMQKIEHQHIHFAVVGFGIALSKAIADTGRFHTRLMRVLFALLMVTLGLLLITYTE